jgi:hypothetical protein
MKRRQLPFLYFFGKHNEQDKSVRADETVIFAEMRNNFFAGIF